MMIVSDQNILVINNMWWNIIDTCVFVGFYYMSLNIPLTHGYETYEEATIGLCAKPYVRDNINCRS